MDTEEAIKKVTCLLAAAMMLGANLDREACRAEPAADPGAAALSAEEPETMMNPTASVTESNEALLELKIGTSPRDLLFEEVKHSPGGAPLSEADVRYGANDKELGRMVARFNASGRLLSHEFRDGAGRILARSRGVAAKDKPFVVQAWSPASKTKMTKLQAGGVVLAAYSYDRAGRLSKSLHPLPAEALGASVEYTYSTDGRLARKVLRLKRGVTATALYNAQGKRRQQEITKPGKGALRISYSYNPRGILSQAQVRAEKASGAVEEMTSAEFLYDKAGRFQEQEVRSNGVLAMRAVLTRDANGKANGTALYSYQDGKITSTTTMLRPDDKTLDVTQFDASGKMLERRRFTDPKKGQTTILLLHEEVLADGFKRVTTFDARGHKSSETYLDPNGKIVGSPGSIEPRPRPNEQAPQAP